MNNDASGMALIFELVDRVFRSWWTLVAGACLGLAGALIALNVIPEVYQATAKIWIRKQQVPGDVVQSNVRDDLSMRILTFRASILEQPYMVELIRRTFGLPEKPAQLRRMENAIRGAVKIQPIQSREAGQQGFQLVYQDVDPERSALVLNTLTELFIEQHSEFRVSQATRTAEAIESILESARQEFEEIDRAMREIKLEHPFETEAHLESNARLLESKQRELEGSREKQEEAREQLAQLEELLSQAEESPVTTDLGALPPGTSALDPLTQKIAQLQRDLDSLKISYSERHPTYRQKLRELEDALAQARARDAQTPSDATGEETDDPAVAVDPAFAALRRQVEAARTAVADLVEQERKLLGAIAEYDRRIQNTPTVQIELNELMGEHQTKQMNYRRLQRELEEAEGTTDLERSDFGQRLELIEQAGVPRIPVSPQPLNVIGIGVAIGLAVFVAPVVLRQLLNPLVVSEAGLSGLSDVPILVAVPRIRTKRNQGLGRRRFLFNLSLSLAAAALLAGTFHYLG